MRTRDHQAAVFSLQLVRACAQLISIVVHAFRKCTVRFGIALRAS